MRNRPEYLEALFAIWHAGLVAVPINARLHATRSPTSSKTARPPSSSPTPSTRKNRRRRRRSSHPGSSGTGHVVIAGAAHRSAAGRPGLAVLHERHDRPAQGRDAHPPQPAVDDLSYYADIDSVTAQDCILTPRRCRTARGSTGCPTSPAGRSTSSRIGRLRPREIAALLGHWPGMSFFAAPTMVKRLIDDAAMAAADLSHLKTIIYGGAPMYLAT